MIKSGKRMNDFCEILHTIDWRRMAQPQVDQYDTQIVLRLAESGTSAQRHQPYIRRPVSDVAAQLFDGEVAVRQAQSGGLGSEQYEPAATDSTNLTLASNYLKSWPAIYEQFKQLIDTIYPYIDHSLSILQAQESLGSCSHSYERDFGAILVSIDNALGLAQALVHEMAHQKLRALGVSFETAHRLITNPRDQSFKSPVRVDRPRPMTAVFHGQYSFMHVTALDLHMLDKETDPYIRECLLMLLKRNTIRMIDGYQTIEREIKTDEVGEIFVSAFMEWSASVLDEAEKLLATTGYD
jgi:hypothetical protein